MELVIFKTIVYVTQNQISIYTKTCQFSRGSMTSRHSAKRAVIIYNIIVSIQRQTLCG